jgi:hypothetical protein
LQAYVQKLEVWALQNQADARQDTIRFWALKLPAILFSAASSILILLKLEVVAAIAAAVATICVLIDGVNPGGMLRNAHLKAVHELRSLQHEVVAQWQVGSLRGEPASELAASILSSGQATWARIGADLRAAETAFESTPRK